jgi:hypothetical protein
MYSQPVCAFNRRVNIDLGNSNEFLLYNLNDDIGQQENLAQSNPEKLQEMIETFQNIRGNEFNEIEQLELK